MGWVVNATLRPHYPREPPGTHCIEGWLGPGTGLDGWGNLAPPGFDSRNRPARSKSLYRLPCSGPLHVCQATSVIRHTHTHTHTHTLRSVDNYVSDEGPISSLSP